MYITILSLWYTFTSQKILFVTWTAASTKVTCTPNSTCIVCVAVNSLRRAAIHSRTYLEGELHTFSDVSPEIIHSFTYKEYVYDERGGGEKKVFLGLIDFS